MRPIGGGQYLSTPAAFCGVSLRPAICRPTRWRALRVSSGRIVDILNAKPRVSAETALRLGRYFGNDPQFWINLQVQFDFAVAMRDVGPRVKREVEQAAQFRHGRT